MQNDDDDKVGYGKPPKKHRFQKGKSGNPRGRPRRLPVVDINEILGAELESNIAVTQGGKKKTITKMQAFAKQMVQKAIAGDKFAAKMVMDIILNRPLKFQKLEAATQADEALLQNFLQIAERYQQEECLGLINPDVE